MNKINDIPVEYAEVKDEQIVILNILTSKYYDMELKEEVYMNIAVTPQIFNFIKGIADVERSSKLEDIYIINNNRFTLNGFYKNLEEYNQIQNERREQARKSS